MIEYGDEVSSAPRATPSSLNWTPATPLVNCPATMGSVADADTVTDVPETVVLGVGAVIETWGGVVSALETGFIFKRPVFAGSWPNMGHSCLATEAPAS